MRRVPCCDQREPFLSRFVVFVCFVGGMCYWGTLLRVLRPGAHIFRACGTFLVALLMGFGVVQKYFDQNNNAYAFERLFDNIRGGSN